MPAEGHCHSTAEHLHICQIFYMVHVFQINGTDKAGLPPPLAKLLCTTGILDFVYNSDTNSLIMIQLSHHTISILSIYWVKF